MARVCPSRRQASWGRWGWQNKVALLVGSAMLWAALRSVFVGEGRHGGAWPPAAQVSERAQAAVEGAGTFATAAAAAGLSKVERDLASAAPWLLPPRTSSLPYSGLEEDLDRLLEVQSRLRTGSGGTALKTVTAMVFSRRMAPLLQNTVYSMTKFGDVGGFVVGTYKKDDLDACLDLNLPCFNASAFLPAPLDEHEVGQWGQWNYWKMVWAKPRIAAHIINQGYAVHFTDVDITFTRKPLWDSYFALLEESGADMALQSEPTWIEGKRVLAVNSGNYVLLPTPAGRAMVSHWAQAAAEFFPRKQGDQGGLLLLRHALVTDELPTVEPGNLNGTWLHCVEPVSCRVAAAYGRNYTSGGEGRPPLAVVRSYYPAWWSWVPELCANRELPKLEGVDVCDWTVLYYHPVCANVTEKLAVFKALGLWLLEEDCGYVESSAPGKPVQRCRPRVLADPAAEAKLTACPVRLGLVPPRAPVELPSTAHPARRRLLAVQGPG